MHYYIDTEFIERGYHFPLELLSIAVVAQDGREFYGESRQADRSVANDWVMQNVLPHLTGPLLDRPRLAQGILQLVGDDPKPVFWGYFADYDWVLFCGLFGTMMHLPKHLPMFCMDLKQELVNRGILSRPLIEVEGPPHHALIDARWNKAVHAWLLANPR